MPQFKVQLGDGLYRIVEDCKDGEEGDAVEYGELAEIEVDHRRYIALVAEDDEERCVSMLGDEWVYEAQPVKTATEEVDFDEEDAGGEAPETELAKEKG